MNFTALILLITFQFLIIQSTLKGVRHYCLTQKRHLTAYQKKWNR